MTSPMTARSAAGQAEPGSERRLRDPERLAAAAVAGRPAPPVPARAGRDWPGIGRRGTGRRSGSRAIRVWLPGSAPATVARSPAEGAAKQAAEPKTRSIPPRRHQASSRPRARIGSLATRNHSLAASGRSRSASPAPNPASAGRPQPTASTPPRPASTRRSRSRPRPFSGRSANCARCGRARRPGSAARRSSRGGARAAVGTARDCLRGHRGSSHGPLRTSGQRGEYAPATARRAPRVSRAGGRLPAALQDGADSAVQPLPQAGQIGLGACFHPHGLLFVRPGTSARSPSPNGVSLNLFLPSLS